MSIAFAIGETRALGLQRAWQWYGRWWFELPALLATGPIVALVVFAVIEKTVDMAAFTATFSLETTTGLISSKARAATPTIGRVLTFASVAMFIAWWGYSIATGDATPKKGTMPIARPAESSSSTAEPSPIQKVLPYFGVWVVGVIAGAMSDVVKDQLKTRLKRSEPRRVQLVGIDGRPLNQEDRD